MLNKRGTVVIAIFIFVIAVLILTAGTLTQFLLLTRDDATRIYTTEVIDSVYAREAQINYFIEKLINNVEVDLNSSTIEEDFRTEFKKELESYKSNFGSYVIQELIQLEAQIDENEIIVDYLDGKISIEFYLLIQDSLVYERDQIYFLKHEYSKVFEKEIS